VYVIRQPRQETVSLTTVVVYFTTPLPRPQQLFAYFMNFIHIYTTANSTSNLRQLTIDAIREAFASKRKLHPAVTEAAEHEAAIRWPRRPGLAGIVRGARSGDLVILASIRAAGTPGALRGLLRKLDRSGVEVRFADLAVEGSTAAEIQTAVLAALDVLAMCRRSD
jgi:hypothetical protein